MLSKLGNMYNASQNFSSFLNNYTPDLVTPPSYTNLASNVYGGTNNYTAIPPSYGNYSVTNPMSITDFANQQYINNAYSDLVANSIANANASQFISTPNQDFSAWDGSFNNDMDFALAKVDQPFWEYDTVEGGAFSNTDGGEAAYWSDLADQVQSENEALVTGRELAESVIDTDGSMQITETEVLDLSREAILGKPEKYGDTTAEQLADGIMADIDAGNFSSADFEQYLADSGNSLDSIEGFDYQSMKAAANGTVGSLAQKLKAANDGGYGVKLVDDMYYDQAQNDPMMMTYGQYEDLAFGDPFTAVEGDFLVQPMSTEGMSYGDFMLSGDPTNPIQSTRLNSIQRKLSPQGTQWTDIDKFNPYDLTGFSRGDARESYTDFLRGMPVYDNNGYGLNPTVRKATNFLGNILDPIDDLVTGTGKLIGGGISKVGDVVSGIPIIGNALGGSLRGLGGGIAGTAYGLGDLIDQGPQNLISSPVQALQGLGQLAMGDTDRGLNNLGRAGTDLIQIGKDVFSVPAGMAQTVVNTIRPLIPKNLKISISVGAGGGGGGGGGRRPEEKKKSSQVTRQTKTGNIRGRDGSRTQPIRFDNDGNPVTSGRTGSRSGGQGLSGASPAGDYDLSTEAGQRAYAQAYKNQAFDSSSPYYLPTILDGLGIPNLMSGGNDNSSFSLLDYVNTDIDYRNTGRESEPVSEIEALTKEVADLKAMGNQSVPAAYRV